MIFPASQCFDYILSRRVLLPPSYQSCGCLSNLTPTSSMFQKSVFDLWYPCFFKKCLAHFLALLYPFILFMAFQRIICLREYICGNLCLHTVRPAKKRQLPFRTARQVPILRTKSALTDTIKILYISLVKTGYSSAILWPNGK